MPNNEAVLRARMPGRAGWFCPWMTVLLCLASLFAGSTRAEIHETVLDWEQACEGSSIRVTSKDGQLLLVEASVQHFAEARDWICVFKEGALISAAYRHYTISRKPKGDSGEFEIQSTLDHLETFKAEQGILQKAPANLKADLETVLGKARASLSASSQSK